MTTSSVPATRLKKGELILIEGQGDEIFKVKTISTSSPGKHGHAKVRILYENILTGAGGEVTYSGHKEIEKPVIEKEKAQVLSVTPKVVSPDPKIAPRPAVVQLMNLVTFETYELQVSLDMDDTQMQPGVELDIRFYSTKKWIDRIAPASTG